MNGNEEQRQGQKERAKGSQGIIKDTEVSFPLFIGNPGNECLSASQDKNQQANGKIRNHFMCFYETTQMSQLR